MECLVEKKTVNSQKVVSSALLRHLKASREKKEGNIILAQRGAMRVEKSGGAYSLDPKASISYTDEKTISESVEGSAGVQAPRSRQKGWLWKPIG